MNILVTDYSTAIAASHLDDVRLHKAITTVARLMSNTARHRDFYCKGMLGKLGGELRDDPIVQWPILTYVNFMWLADYGIKLIEERAMRFPDARVHKQEQVIKGLYPFSQNEEVMGNFPPNTEPVIHFVNAAYNHELGINFTDVALPDAYHHYLAARWRKDITPPMWTRRDPPIWFVHSKGTPA